MILRLLTCFSLFTHLAHGAQVSGTVSIHDANGRAKAGDLSGVVLYFIPLDPDAPSAPNPGLVQMLQHHKMFVPHILAIQMGTSVSFPNLDPIFHNAFSSYSGQIFDIGLYPPGKTRIVKFSRPGVVRVFCNIHPSMSAVILVLPTPYFTQTASTGHFSLDLPPGKYKLQVFHERATEKTLSGLSSELSVGQEPVHLTPIQLSEAGWLPVPHLNKYGRPYSVDAGNESVYPGVRH